MDPLNSTQQHASVLQLLRNSVVGQMEIKHFTAVGLAPLIMHRTLAHLRGENSRLRRNRDGAAEKLVCLEM